MRVYVQDMRANVQFKPPVETAVAKLVLRRDRLAQFRRLKNNGKMDSDSDFAKKIGLTPGQVSRVLRGDAPGPKFIAGVLELFGIEFFQDLFTVEPSDGNGNAA